MKAIPERIKELRKALGLRQADLAEKVGDHLLTGKEPGRAEALFAMEQKMREAESKGQKPTTNHEADLAHERK